MYLPACRSYKYVKTSPYLSRYTSGMRIIFYIFIYFISPTKGHKIPYFRKYRNTH